MKLHGLLIALLISVFTFPALAENSMPFETALKEIATPIHAEFQYQDRGSDNGVYDHYAVRAGVKARKYQALMSIAQNRQLLNDGDLAEVRGKIAYWLAYFPADLSNTSQFDSLRELLDASHSNLKRSEFTRLFEAIESVIGKDYLHQALKILSKPESVIERIGFPSSSKFFGEDVLRVGNGSLSTSLLLMKRYDEPFDYSSFWDLQYRLHGQNTETIDFLAALHDPKSFDLGRVFGGSLKYYVYYNLSLLGGYGYAYSNIQNPEARSTYWMDVVHRIIGEERMWRILEGKMMTKGLLPYQLEKLTAENIREYYVTTAPVDTLEDGILRWAAKDAPEGIRSRILDWVMTMAAFGKDWTRFEQSYDGQRDYSDLFRKEDFIKTLRSAIQSHVQEAIERSNGQYQNVGDVLVAKGLLSRERLDSIAKWSEAIAEQQNRVEQKAVPKARPKWQDSLLSMLGLQEAANDHAVRKALKASDRDRAKLQKTIQDTAVALSQNDLMLFSLFIDKKTARAQEAFSVMKTLFERGLPVDRYVTEQVLVAQTISGVLRSSVRSNSSMTVGADVMCRDLFVRIR